MEYFKLALSKYTEFTGRTTRKEFWMYVLFYFIFYIGLSLVGALLGIGIISVLYSLALLVPSIAATTRRLHDTGRSGWWQLISLIPLVGLIILIVFLVQDSQEDNDYGPRSAATV